MRLIWVTDIHLNFVNEDGANAFAQAIRNQAPQVLLVGGDIAEAHDVEHWLRWLVKAVEVPVYFVLGNHDYYRGSIAGVRETVRALCSVVDGLTWLSEQGPISLTEQTALIGHGCWGDGRLGDFLRSSVMLNDYVLIRELSGSIPMQRLEQLHRLGDEAAAHLRTSLEAALKSHQHVLALTHVPPFREACWHEGQLSEDNWLPHFTCGAAGETLRDVMAEHPGQELTVLCGHTHGSGEAKILPNLTVKTGGAEYYKPSLQPPVTVE